MPEQRITGEALYALLLAAQPDLAYTWRDLNTFDRDVYTEVATTLNGTYLAPLQGLVRDWRKLLQEHDELSVMSIIEIDDWRKHWELLKRRSSELLREEQKVKE